MSQPDRIAFVCPRFSEEGTVGGAETLLKNLAIHAVKSGHSVDFLTTCAESHFTWENTLPPGESECEGVRVLRFPVDEDRDVGTFLRVQTAISNRSEVSESDERLWITNSVHSSALVSHLIKCDSAYDRVIAGPYLFGLTYAVARECPGKTILVPCLHDEPFAYVSLMKEMFEGARGFMFNSEPEQHLAQRLFDVPGVKCSVVGMGLDVFDVEPKSIGAPYVIYSGRREPLKGTPLLLEYMAAFRERTGKDVKVVFTGSGPIEPPPELAPHVKDLGFVSDEEKWRAMAGATAFVHPSVNESFGIVLLESWLARTPGLVHDRSEVLKWQCRQSGAGFWFRHYPDFEDELMRLLTDRDLNKAMGEAGRQYVLDTYSWENVQNRFNNALAQL